MGRIETVQSALLNAIASAIRASGITAKGVVYFGEPRPEQLRQFMDAGGWNVTVKVLPGGKKIPTSGFYHRYATFDPPGMFATITGNMITFSGIARAGLNVRAFVVHPTLGTRAVPYATGANDNLLTIASAIATGINALPAPLSATAIGATVTISGVTGIKCKVGSAGTSTIAQETARFDQPMQVSIYAPSAYLRSGDPVADAAGSIRANLIDAIEQAVGTDVSFEYDLGDGTSVRLRQTNSPVLIDNSQSDYSVFEAHIQYSAQYSTLTVDSATQVVEIDASQTANAITKRFVIGG